MDHSLINHGIYNIEQQVKTWHPGTVLRHTNWLYRLGVLRLSDFRRLNLLAETIVVMREYTLHLLI